MALRKKKNKTRTKVKTVRHLKSGAKKVCTCKTVKKR
jgi:hypothetical protein